MEKNTIKIFKNCVFILTRLNVSHLQSTLHLMQYTYEDIFSTAQNNFWIWWFWCLLASAVFLFHFFNTSKTFFPLRTYLIQKNKKKVSWGKIGWIGSVQHGGHAGFGRKLLNTQRGVSRCTVNHPSWNGQTHWKSLQKNSLKLNTASDNNAGWYTTRIQMGS